ncbi:MAG: ABC transporter ATP-binding protein [Anaerolineales bacterium]|jgi:multiple sugar transport system ATP-binding protein
MASIRLENLDKRYGKVHAVKEINLEIAEGEFIAFLGPSGCGKSSTMRCIAGLEEISGGTIYFNERNVNRVRPRDRGVAMAFETYALYPTLNVHENLAFPLRAARMKDEEIGKRVAEIAGILEITDLLDRMPRGLSSGQQQRVGLARALIKKPEVFVLDEPISHLDTRQRGRMRAYLKRLHIELGHTMVYVTHDQEEAMAMADRITVMRDGHLIQTGTPEEVYHQPVDIFVAGFIGEPATNFLDCRLEQDGNECILEAMSDADVRLPMPERMVNQARSGAIPDEVTLGIRPFYVHPSFEADNQHIIPARVFVMEPLGDSTVVTVDVADARMQVVTPPDFTASPKQDLWLAFDPARVLLFDRSTTRTIANGRAMNEDETTTIPTT